MSTSHHKNACPWWIILSISLLVLMCGVAGCVWWGIAALNRPGPEPKSRIIHIPPGFSRLKLPQLVGPLTQAPSWVLHASILLLRPKLRHGEFAIPPHPSLRDIFMILESSPPYLRNITLPEGLTVRQMCALLHKAPGLKGACAATLPEGTIAPDTYSYTYGQDLAALIPQWQTMQRHRVHHAWSARLPGLPLASPQELLILASIVEKETALPHERPLVAAVFINRLNVGMPLQADPTVAYGLGQTSGTLLTRADLKASPLENPYSTYTQKGLPPGPIATPGHAALMATAQPATVPYLYFVADGRGGHAFSTTLAEHANHHASWRAIRTDRSL